jgi:hypothetical protein
MEWVFDGIGTAIISFIATCIGGLISEGGFVGSRIEKHRIKQKQTIDSDVDVDGDVIQDVNVQSKDVNSNKSVNLKQKIGKRTKIGGDVIQSGGRVRK